MLLTSSCTCLAAVNVNATYFPMWLILNTGGTMYVCMKLLCLDRLTGPGKDFSVDDNCRAWYRSFTEHGFCLLSDRIITHEPK